MKPIESSTETVLRAVIEGDPYHKQFAPLLDEIDRLRERLAAVEAERDALERELHYESVMLHTALLGRNCTEEGAVTACHPMVCDCGTPYEDYSFRELCEAVATIRTQAERAERILAALRDPSDTVVDAAASEVFADWCEMRRAIRAAVAAAEKEVNHEN